MPPSSLIEEKKSFLNSFIKGTKWLVKQDSFENVQNVQKWSGNIQMVLKPFGKWEMIWKNLDSFETILKTGKDPENQDDFETICKWKMIWKNPDSFDP